ncbi:hypothetical protein L7F22_067100 [Adiantum nelumboides]|nr:hypothetical protein [Adiantum nelumboides]
MANVIPNVRASRRRPPPFGTEGNLDGTNYTLWKFKIKAILNSYELLQMATDQDRMPSPTLSPFDLAIIILANPALVTAWQRRDANTLCAIVTRVSSGILPLIQHASNTAKAWQILQHHYKMRNQTRVYNLENQLVAENFTNGESAETFITRIKNLRDQMAAIGIGTKSQDHAQRCIHVLPPRYDSHVTSSNTQVHVPPFSFEEFLRHTPRRRDAAKIAGGVETPLSLQMQKGREGQHVEHPHHQPHNSHKRVKRCLRIAAMDVHSIAFRHQHKLILVKRLR